MMAGEVFDVARARPGISRGPKIDKLSKEGNGQAIHFQGPIDELSMILALVIKISQS